MKSIRNPHSFVQNSAQGHKATSGPLAVAQRRVDVAMVDYDPRAHLLLQGILAQTQEFYSVGSYFSGEEALIDIPQTSVQIVVMDIKLPGMSGTECTRQLKALLPHLIIVMVTAHVDPETINLARQAGADTFLAKPFPVDQLLATLRFWRSDRKAKPLSAAGASVQSVKWPLNLNFSHLTPEENELVKYLASGLLYKEIAAKMHEKESDVRNQVHQLYIKIHVSNRTEAANWLWNQCQGADGETIGLS